MRAVSLNGMEISAIEPPVPGGLSAPGRHIISWERPGNRSIIKHEGSLLLLNTVVLSLSWAMPLLQSRNLWPDIPCLFNRLTGLPCLTCGLTRSFSLTVHGEIWSAFEMHLLGPPLFLLLVISGVYLVTAVCSGSRINISLTQGEKKIAFISVLCLFVVCWLVKIFFLKGGW